MLFNKFEPDARSHYQTRACAPLRAAETPFHCPLAVSASAKTPNTTVVQIPGAHYPAANRAHTVSTHHAARHSCDTAALRAPWPIQARSGWNTQSTCAWRETASSRPTCSARACTRAQTAHSPLCRCAPGDTQTTASSESTRAIGTAASEARIRAPLRRGRRTTDKR